LLQLCAHVGSQRDPEQGTSSPADRRAKTDDNNAGRHGVDDERRRVERGADGCHQLPVGTIGQDASDSSPDKPLALACSGEWSGSLTLAWRPPS
jgi:hypothetical protein